MNFDYLHFESISSTNDYIRDNISLLSLPVVVSADMQTSGRGRRGKSFYSPPTGLYFSIAFEANPSFDLITPAAAVCVCNSIFELTGINADIKWVNDVYLGGKKICGILTERFVSEGKTITICGIGINLTTEEFPEDIPIAGSLGKNVVKEELCKSIASSLLSMNVSFDRENLLKDYEKKLFIKGKEITYTKDGDAFSGFVEGINNDCNLIVKNSEGTTILSSGEISIIMR